MCRSCDFKVKLLLIADINLKNYNLSNIDFEFTFIMPFLHTFFELFYRQEKMEIEFGNPTNQTNKEAASYAYVTVSSDYHVEKDSNEMLKPLTINEKNMFVLLCFICLYKADLFVFSDRFQNQIVARNGNSLSFMTNTFHYVNPNDEFRIKYLLMFLRLNPSTLHG